jgi:low affinity Fe/Cu permease
MGKKSSIKWLVCLITAVAALTAAVTAFFFIKEKQKKDDEQLEEYLDYSIQ